MSTEINSIGNFTVEDIREINEITETEKIPSVKFTIVVNGVDRVDKTVPLSGPNGLGKLNWYDVHPHIVLKKSSP